MEKPDLRLAALLSATAGAVDVIGLQRLGLFTAHITGNIVFIAAQLVAGGPPRRLQILAVPVFMIAVAATWLIAKALERGRVQVLRPLLIVQLLFIAGVLLTSVISSVTSLEAMLAVSAMACQFATLRIALPGTPSTAVMTGNLTAIVLSALDIVSAPTNDAATAQLRKAGRSFLGFFVGCVIGALAVFWFRGWAWSFPLAIAALAAVSPTR